MTRADVWDHFKSALARWFLIGALVVCYYTFFVIR